MIEIIQTRLKKYHPANALDEENALKEIVQEILLFALWRAGFFEEAAFQGGTSLRILHGMSRFSEDIDFILRQQDLEFQWRPYLENIAETCEEFGIAPEILDKQRMDSNVKAALIKDTSIANQLNLRFRNRHPGKKVTIKLEIDVNPPAGSNFEYSYLDFPVDYEVCHQDLASNFALKIHALLCRPWLKGRDWYDFSWYLAQGVSPNIELLGNALAQHGPWRGQKIAVDHVWLVDALRNKVASIDWREAALDVERFLKPVEQKSLRLWSDRFFLHKIGRLAPG
ncbi:MAG TPA: nucleotidyl transferase AbiEii/AbiGii toxin family protein [Gammaproteobacteria bacterium]|nr:nucleotidyl transferase AbiEii/AbiGii toxin family protein [Gammaproteobacteria bacterium]